MPETSPRDPLANLEAFESGAFRVGHVARRLLTDHPDLPLRQIQPVVMAFQDPAGPHRLTIVRDGRPVHTGAARGEGQ